MQQQIIMDAAFGDNSYRGFVLLQNPDALRQNLGDYAGKVLTVLQDAANANINISVTVEE